MPVPGRFESVYKSFSMYSLMNWSNEVPAVFGRQLVPFELIGKQKINYKFYPSDVSQWGNASNMDTRRGYKLQFAHVEIYVLSL